jgi:hypothetical protein
VSEFFDIRTLIMRAMRVPRQYHKGNLITQFGPDIALPDLRHEIAKCDRRGKMHDACAVHCVGLAGALIRSDAANGPTVNFDAHYQIAKAQ